MKDSMSLYQTMQSQTPKDPIHIDNYIGFVKAGAYQDNVLNARSHREKAKQHHKSDPEYAKYLELKQQQPCVTGSAIMNSGSKTESNIKEKNGMIVIDIDTEVSEDLIGSLKYDKYTRVLHRSFGGDGICIFVRINQLKDFRDSFEGLAQYYMDNYSVKVDASCSNPNRLRYMSYDPYLFENDKSSVFTHKTKKKEPKPHEMNFVFSADDFDHIMEQIKDKHIDLCDEDYAKYVKIGMGIANKFGESGREKFHFICSFGSKYNPKDTDRDYNGFTKSTNGKCSIASVYYLAKEAGLDLYSEKTKNIINKVKISKSQGKPTFESIAQNMAMSYGITLNEADKDLVSTLIESNIDYSKIANEGTSQMDQLINFVMETSNPSTDALTLDIYFNDIERPISDKDINTLYLNACRTLDFTVNKNDIVNILMSDSVKEIDKLKDFFKDNKHNEVGFIEQYARCIEPYNEYNVWAFKKWLVGMVHNWTADIFDREVSPLTLVLTGKGGRGKSSFFRNMMPEELYKYHREKKINPKDKDDFFLLATCLMLVDEEFGGAVKDVKDYKAMSDANSITQRRPYGKVMETFKRRAGLGGNSNEKAVQKDVTGNRRILPVNVERIDYDGIKEIDKVKLFVEAYNELNSPDFDWRIYKDEDIQYLKENSEDNEEIMPLEDIFDTFFSTVPTEKHNIEKVLSQGILLNFLNIHTSMRPTRFELKDVLTKKGLENKVHAIKGSTKRDRGYKLYVQHSTNIML